MQPRNTPTSTPPFPTFLQKVKSAGGQIPRSTAVSPSPTRLRSQSKIRADLSCAADLTLGIHHRHEWRGMHTQPKLFAPQHVLVTSAWCDHATPPCGWPRTTPFLPKAPRLAFGECLPSKPGMSVARRSPTPLLFLAPKKCIETNYRLRDWPARPVF